MGMIEDPPFARALFVASGTAYWKAYSGGLRALMAALWWGIVPAATAWNGYLPMRAARQGDDVPAGVAREWARWGKDPRYVFSWAEPRGGLSYVRWDGPLRALGYRDDNYAPEGATRSLLALYTKSKIDFRLAPGPVGHFGFFKKPELWPAEADYLTGS
jgi:predicted alpha/beta hydrolase